MKNTSAQSVSEQQGEILTYKSAAALLSMPIGTLYGLVSQKRIPHFRLSARTVLFERQQLLDWLRGHAVSVHEVAP
jgi:excisionase family DNA binding protein